MRRLGICISSDAVRAVLLRRGTVAWHSRSPIAPQEKTIVALERLLADVPSFRLGRRSVRVAFGLAHSQVKRIEGLPPARQPKVVDRIIRENVDSFFLRLGTRTLVADIDRRADGSTWAAALDGALLDDVLATLRRRRLSTNVVLPFAAAVAQAVPTGTWYVTDGPIEAELHTIEGACRRRLPGAAPIESPPPPVAALDPLGLEFLAAYGVAIASPRTTFAWRPAPDPARVRAFDIARVSAASIVLVASTAAALFARGAHASLVASAAAKDLAGFHNSEIDAARVDVELRRATADLDRIRQFDATRGRTTALLGALSEALPDSTALISLRLDSLEGNFVALTPHAADVLPQLLELPGVVSPRIVGSVTRELQGGARVERAAIRFQRKRAVQPTPTSR